MPLKVALVHYWFAHRRGGERVVEAVLDLFPGADVFTHVLRPEALAPPLEAARVRTTFIARLPWAQRAYPYYLPLMPLALEQLDLEGYDLVISSEAGPAKGVIVPPGALHICYCHSPMRYLWDLRHEYTARAPWPLRGPIALLGHYLRIADQASAVRVHRFVANSRFVADRIRTYWGREASVIHPPVDTAFYGEGEPRPREDAYLMAGQLVGYKRADLAIEATRRLGRRLVIVGDGEMRARLERAAPPHVAFVGRASDAELRDHYARCRALLFPGVEDFGIVPVEAMATGAPVIAYGRGGATESVIDGRTGVLFREQTVEGLMEGIRRFEEAEGDLDPLAIRGHARQFGRERFQREFSDFVTAALQDR